MSGYFDGLMRATGLPLGNAPRIGPTPRRVLALDEPPVESIAALAPNPFGPTSQASSQTHAVAMPRAERLASIGSPTVPERVPPPAPARGASAAPEAATGRSVEEPMPPARAEVASPAQPTPGSPTPTTGAPIVDATPITSERVIQAAMRWVAAGGTPQAVAAAVSIPGNADQVLPSSDQAATQRQAQPAHRDSLPMARLATRELASTSRGQEPQGVGHRAVAVTIGAIHLRIDPPQATTPMAAPAPTPIPREGAPAVSGLARRALRRL